MKCVAHDRNIAGLIRGRARQNTVRHSQAQSNEWDIARWLARGMILQGMTLSICEQPSTTGSLSFVQNKTGSTVWWVYVCVFASRDVTGHCVPARKGGMAPGVKKASSEPRGLWKLYREEALVG